MSSLAQSLQRTFHKFCLKKQSYLNRILLDEHKDF